MAKVNKAICLPDITSAGPQVPVSQMRDKSGP